MSNPNEPYHNEGFGWAFLNIVIFTLIVPGIIILSIDNGFAKFAEMRGVTGDCWENSRHERVCTCLLYTSPSPRDGLLSRMPSSA